MRRPQLLAVVAVLFAAIFALRLYVEGNEEGVSLLYSLPVALLAGAYGLRAGVAAAALAIALYALYVEVDDEAADALSYVTRATTFLVLGGVLGLYSERLRSARRELQAANRELARSNADLERYASVASHDLQEPLRVVTTYTELLAEDLDDRLGPDDRESMGFILDGAARMRALIDGLLQFSRVRPAAMLAAPVPLDVVLERALANLDVALHESGAQVTHDPLPTVRGDEQALQQVLQNLVGNAIKFRRPDAVPHVHVSARRAGGAGAAGGGWAVDVADDGIGIDPEASERVFGLFERLHAKGAYPGAGIGLALCARIVEAHGGTIAARPNPDHGTTITFTLPEAPPS